MFDYVFLQLVICLYGLFSCQPVFIISAGPGICAVQPVQRAQPAAALYFMLKFLSKRNLPVFFFYTINIKTVQPLTELSDLLLDSHLLQQLLRTLCCLLFSIHKR